MESCGRTMPKGRHLLFMPKRLDMSLRMPENISTHMGVKTKKILNVKEYPRAGTSGMDWLEIVDTTTQQL